MDLEEEKSDQPSTTNSRIHITRRTNRSPTTFIFHKIIHPFGPLLVKTKKEFPPGSPRLDIPSKVRKRCDISERQVESIYLYDVVGANHGTLEKKRKHRVYYFAGGGWHSPPSSHHWKYFSDLATRLPHTIITVVSYPLAPNSPAPVTFPQLLKLYSIVLEESKQHEETVTFAGDSAGGNIVLALVLEALRQDPTALKPYSILAICPSVDLSRRNPDIKKIAKHDPIMRFQLSQETAEAWCGYGRDDFWNCLDTRVSPLEADISLFREHDVTVDGMLAGYDLLGPDGKRFLEKLQKDGVQGEWMDWDKQMHCWPLSASYGLFPESKEGFDWIVDLLNRRSVNV